MWYKNLSIYKYLNESLSCPQKTLQSNSYVKEINLSFQKETFGKRSKISLKNCFKNTLI